MMQLRIETAHLLTTWEPLTILNEAIMAFPYVASPDRLKSLLTKLAGEVGIPAKFDTKFLKTLGFTSSNDQRMLSAIKFIGLADQKGNPTDLWKKLRADSGSAVAMGIRQGYADLFSHFPDAHLKDDEALRSFFSAQTTLGAHAVAKMVSTFKAFRDLTTTDRRLLFQTVSSHAHAAGRAPHGEFWSKNVARLRQINARGSRSVLFAK
jgi:hypothetical protein